MRNLVQLTSFRYPAVQMDLARPESINRVDEVFELNKQYAPVILRIFRLFRIAAIISHSEELSMFNADSALRKNNGSKAN